MEKKNIYLIRHGESEFNVQKKFCGCNECDLSSLGKVQAKLLGEEMKNIRLDEIYASPIKRARLTAQAMGENIIFDDDLRELNFGEFEGFTFDEIEKKHPEYLEAMLKKDFSYTFPGGEQMQKFYERVTNAYDKIVKNSKGNRIAIVAHSCVIRCILSYVLINSPDLYWKMHLSNVGVSKISHYNDGGIVKYINRELKLK